MFNNHTLYEVSNLRLLGIDIDYVSLPTRGDILFLVPPSLLPALLSMLM